MLPELETICSSSWIITLFSLHFSLVYISVFLFQLMIYDLLAYVLRSIILLTIYNYLPAPLMQCLAIMYECVYWTLQ